MIDKAFERHSASLAESNPSKAAENLFNAIFGGGFFLTLLALSIAFQVIGLIITIFSTATGLGALATIALSIIIPLVIMSVLGAIFGESLNTPAQTILYLIYPADDPFWEEGVGLGVISIIPALINIIKQPKGIGKGLLGLDGFWLVIAFFGLILGLGSGMAAACLSLAIAALGFGGTCGARDWFDSTTSPFRFIEEILAGICTGYAFVNAIKQCL